MAYEKSDLNVWEEIQSESSDDSCTDDDDDDDDDDFDAGHLRQSSCDSEIKYQWTNADTANEELHSDKEKNSNVEYILN